MISVGIVGGTGYTGAELLRLLAGHREARVDLITSRAEAGVRVDSLYPTLRGVCDLSFEAPDAGRLAECDLVYFATPHGVAMELMPELIKRGTRVVDLSADFRLRDIDVWETWYGQKHTCPELVEQAVYGLPEVNRSSIRDAQLVAAAGCYPTSVQLGFLPLLANELIDESTLIANAASGVSGAGRQAKIDNLLAELSDNFKAYGVSGHRHLPEIEQGLNTAAKQTVQLTFVPHLLPVIRGIHATLYGQIKAEGIDEQALQALYEQYYSDEPFVDVLPAGQLPQTRNVKGSNVCRIAVSQPQQRNTVVICSAIDNLVKGASGQAIQCMNIMLGLNETAGLESVPLCP
ncbi:MAG: N-acetyl-gamma-glutamyl-phosphate reductase [Pseudomonadales bacterium]